MEKKSLRKESLEGGRGSGISFNLRFFVVLTLPDRTKYLTGGVAEAALDRSAEEAAPLVLSSPGGVGGHHGTIAQEVTKIW